MANQKTVERSVQENPRIKEIQSILFLLQESLERFKDEADRSYELIKVGTKTPLAKQIEGYVKDPLKSVLKSSATIDHQVRGLISRLVEQFFISQKEIIQCVFFTKNTNNDLFYSISLKNDTIENRNSIFTFFELYNKLEIYSRYPIFFQFVPIELIGKINNTSEINLEKGAKSHSAGKAQ